MRTIAIVIPIAGADVYLDDLPKGHQGVTNDAGYLEFQVSDLPISYVGVKATGYHDYYQGGVHLPPGNVQIRIGVDPDPGRPQDVILPAMTPLEPEKPVVTGLPRIHVEGLDFVEEGGKRHIIRGSTELMLAWRFDQEGEAAIANVLDERSILGFNNLRVLWQKDIGNTGHSPWLMPVEKLHDFLTECETYGLYVQGTILADCQVCNPNEEDQLRRVASVREATAGESALIEQLGNEYDKNGHEPRHFTRPMDRLAANSSSTEGGKDAMPYWDFFCFSGQRSPMNHAVREYGPLEFMYGSGPWGGVPAICDEGMKPGINSSDPRDWERAGAQARSGCGGRFHTACGTSGNGGLFSELEKACARAFLKGLGV